MMFRMSAVAALFLMLPIMHAGGAQAQTAAPTPEEQRIACEADAHRLCGPEMPDEIRVSRCMTQNIRSVTAQCRAVMQATSKAQRGR